MLASAQRITKITPIPGADNIVCATVLGWEVVIRKDEYKVGDLCAYIEIDTVVPPKPEFEFLKERNYRVRTIKLRKQISQGLIVPLPPGPHKGYWQEGSDLTEYLGIVKYSKDNERAAIGQRPKKPKSLRRRIKWYFEHHILYKVFPFLDKYSKDKFPTHLVSITDEERIQNMPRVLEQYAGEYFIATEKLDGSSITIIHEYGWRTLWRHKFRVCSRRIELFDKDTPFWRVFLSTEFHRHLMNLWEVYEHKAIIVQGEFIGDPQGNKYKLLQNEIRLFNIFVDGKRVPADTFDWIVTRFGIPHCPKIWEGHLHFTLPEILAFAEGDSVVRPGMEREGLVFRRAHVAWPDSQLSFKAISNKFLLKNDE